MFIGALQVCHPHQARHQIPIHGEDQDSAASDLVQVNAEILRRPNQPFLGP
ncbi:MAG: hypothetical protein LW703_04395 [Rhodobacter sp.]|nr:hypothetical protein [Rhodobacter sp.]